MNLNYSVSDKKFVAVAAEFLARHWRATDAQLSGQRGQRVRSRYLAALADSGRLVGHWPREQGGLGWSSRERWLWELEVARVQAPQPSVHGVDLLGAALLAHGTDAQRQTHLPAIAQGVVSWCQAFGEGSQGLDLAQVSTTAAAATVGAEGGWQLTGIKPWVLDVPVGDAFEPGAHWMYLLARIEAGPAPGFGVFLIDLASPGVAISPTKMLGEEANKPAGERHSVATVSLAAVAVPSDALLGPVDADATLALAIEQAEFAQPGVVARNAVLLGQLREFVEGGELDGGSLWRDDDYRAKLHGLEVATAALQALQARSLDAPGEFARSASLVIAAQSRQLSEQLADLQVEALGYFALPYANIEALDNEGPIGPEFSQPVLFGMLSNRAREAVLAPRDHLKNIIAKSVLGLSSATLL